MTASTEFTERLHKTFDGRLRIRWSDKEQRFHIEQRVGRAVPAPIFIDSMRDDLIRARDGYHHVMSITAGDRMACPVCDMKLNVPVMDIRDIRCGYCQLRGRQTRVVAGYWPLNDRLIDHLKKIDPLRDGQSELSAEADRHNQMLLKSQEDAAVADGYAAADERFNKIAGIPQFGYGGTKRRTV